MLDHVAHVVIPSVGCTCVTAGTQQSSCSDAAGTQQSSCIATVTDRQVRARVGTTWSGTTVTSVPPTTGTMARTEGVSGVAATLSTPGDPTATW